MGERVDFEHVLPATCPPDDASSEGLSKVYRVLEGSALAPIDWLTHDERLDKKKPVDADGSFDCRWHSLSLVKDPKKALSFKNLKNRTHCVEIEIPAESGMHRGRGNHLDFWRRKGFVLQSYAGKVSTI